MMMVMDGEGRRWEIQWGWMVKADTRTPVTPSVLRGRNLRRSPRGRFRSPGWWMKPYEDLRYRRANTDQGTGSAIAAPEDSSAFSCLLYRGFLAE